MLLGLGQPPGNAFSLARPAQESARTVLYMHGRIYTNDPQHPWAQALAVRDGKIICVGSISQVMSECAAGEAHPDTVNLREKFVMPGFNDAHVHLGWAGEGMLSVRLYGAGSIEELKTRLAAGVASHKPGEWITGAGWDHTLWPDKQFPNRWELDDVSPQNPVLLTHVSGHVAIEENCFVGVNATIRDKVRIARDCVVGAGALIMRDTQPGQVYAVRGTAAAPLKSTDLDLSAELEARSPRPIGRRPGFAHAA